jgi:hypothetical protein
MKSDIKDNKDVIAPPKKRQSSVRKVVLAQHTDSVKLYHSKKEESEARKAEEQPTRLKKKVSGELERSNIGNRGVIPTSPRNRGSFAPVDSLRHHRVVYNQAAEKDLDETKQQESELDLLKGVIQSFREAKSFEERKEAAEKIIGRKDAFEQRGNYSHFLDLAQDITDNPAKHCAMGDFILPVRLKTDKQEAERLKSYMRALSEGLTESLTEDISKITVLYSILQIDHNFIVDQKKGEIERSCENAVRFITECVKAKNCDNGLVDPLNQQKLLQAILEMPLVLHLIEGYTDKVVANDYFMLLAYGSYLKERDPEFIDRWFKQHELAEKFTNELRALIQSEGEFEGRLPAFKESMREYSIIVAENFIKDLKMLPDSGEQKYGDKTKEEASKKMKKYLVELGDRLATEEHEEGAVSTVQAIEDPKKRTFVERLEEAKAIKSVASTTLPSAGKGC